MSLDSILTIDQLMIQYSDRVLIKDVSFDIKENEAVLLSGANGIGKSTLLKTILGLEPSGKRISGSIVVRGFGDILALSDVDIQRFRASIAYVQQKDDYSEMGNITVRDVISDSSQSYSGKTLSFGEVDDLIDKWIPRKKDGRPVFNSKNKPKHFSGGEQRLLSVLSVLATRNHADLLIIDEPLNNLDFENARNISNVINRVIQENPHMGLLMISHCRIFPFITREIELTPEGIKHSMDHYVCHSCFGHPDVNGYFN